MSHLQGKQSRGKSVQLYSEDAGHQGQRPKELGYPVFPKCLGIHQVLVTGNGFSRAFPSHHRDALSPGDNGSGPSRVTFLFHPCALGCPVKRLMSCKPILSGANNMSYLKGFAS